MDWMVQVIDTDGAPLTERVGVDGSPYGQTVELPVAADADGVMAAVLLWEGDGPPKWIEVFPPRQVCSADHDAVRLALPASEAEMLRELMQGPAGGPL